MDDMLFVIAIKYKGYVIGLSAGGTELIVTNEIKRSMRFGSFRAAGWYLQKLAELSLDVGAIVIQVPTNADGT